MSISLDELALRIDAAIERRDVEKLGQLRKLITELSQTGLDDTDRAALELYSANIASALRQAKGGNEPWNWIQPELETEILHLRRGLVLLGDKGIRELKTDLGLRITTNLANALDHVGRFVEAIEIWGVTIAEHPQFSMAIGNRAQAFSWYSHFVTIPTERALLLRESYRGFRDAMAIGVEPHAEDHMRNWLLHLSSIADWESLRIDFPKFSVGSTKIERRYREWCVQNTLVLSSINDLAQDIDGIQDTLTLPNLFVSLEEANGSPPAVYAIFNQLKQEFTSARFTVFEALEQKDRPLHFADRGVVLCDTLDYRYFRLWTEKLKMAFLAAHAVLDKVAYLVNEYWKLGVKTRAINFNSVWYLKADPKQGLNSIFAKSENWPLRGLYWLSRDFYYKPKTLHAVSPEAKIIHDIRNHIAHKYLRIHDHVLYDADRERTAMGSELSFPVSEIELQSYTIRLLKLVRSALIYVSAAIAHEEKLKEEQLGEKFVVPLPVTAVDDRYRL